MIEVFSRNVSERGGCAGAVPALVAAGAERRVQRAAGGAAPRAAGRAAAAAAPGAAGGLPAAHAPGACRLPPAALLREAAAADHLLNFKYCFISLKELIGYSAISFEPKDSNKRTILAILPFYMFLLVDN